MHDFRGFLDVAERLAEADDESSHRSTISRAYYAVYHEARTVAVARVPRLRDAAPTHERFWRELKRIAEFADIANTGDQLRRARVLADYRADAFDGMDTAKEARASIAAAGSILRDLDTLRGAEFYHYQADPIPDWGGVHVTPWEPGQIHTVGRDFNLYFDFFNQRGWGWASSNGSFHPSVWLAEHVLNVLNGQEAKHPEFDGVYSYDTLETLKFVTWSLKKEADLVRELVFEDVRRERFPNHPSRQRCMWVAPTREAAQFWHAKTSGTKRWFRLRLTGVAHRTNSDYVVADTISLNELRGYAEKYWCGASEVISIRDEILFEGTVEVLAEASAEELGLR